MCNSISNFCEHANVLCAFVCECMCACQRQWRITDECQWLINVSSAQHLYQLHACHFMLIRRCNENPRELTTVCHVRSRWNAIATPGEKNRVEFGQVGKRCHSPETWGVEDGIERLNCCQIAMSTSLTATQVRCLFAGKDALAVA